MSYPQQPYPGQPQMTVNGGGNRNPENKPYDSKGEREWTNGLCSCFGDCGTCCVACWCPCITYNSNKSRRQALEQSGAPHHDGGENCGSDCFLFGLIHCFTSFGWVLEVGARSDTRRRYNIEGGGCGDCMASCCCLPCVLTQESREIEGEETSFGKRG